MPNLGSLPNFSADDFVKSHLTIEAIKPSDLQIPMHFLTNVQAPVSNNYVPNNRVSFSQVFSEQLTSPEGCIDLQFENPRLESPASSTAEVSKHSRDEEQINNLCGE